MKKILLFACFAAVALSGCKKEEPLGPPLEMEPSYALPQPGSSAESGARVVDLFNRYGSYFIWDFTLKDALWTPSVAGQNNSLPNPASITYDYITPGDPEYLDEMLDYVNDVWIKYFPDEEFRRGAGIPYRVLLADTIGVVDKTRPIESPFRMLYKIKIVNKAVIIAGMNRNLPTMTAAQKSANIKEIAKAMFNHYLANGLFTLDTSKFAASADYVSAPEWTIGMLYSQTSLAEHLDKFYKRGFIPNMVPANGAVGNILNADAGNSDGVTYRVWAYNAYSWNTVATGDLGAYNAWAWGATDAQIQPFLDAYPIIARRWQLLIDAYAATDLDVRAIANGR